MNDQMTSMLSQKKNEYGQMICASDRFVQYWYTASNKLTQSMANSLYKLQILNTFHQQTFNLI